METLTRICLTGPECTGKTALAERLGLPWVPEYAREYAEEHGYDLTYDDVEPIARGEIALLDAAPKEGLVILDTDLLSTVVYSRHYYGDCPQWIVDEARRRKADFYLLMDTDIPWERDAVRSPQSADDREALFDAFRCALDEFETEWTIVSGERDERYRKVIEACRGPV